MQSAKPMERKAIVELSPPLQGLKTILHKEKAIMEKTTSTKKEKETLNFDLFWIDRFNVPNK